MNRWLPSWTLALCAIAVPSSPCLAVLAPDALLPDPAADRDACDDRSPEACQPVAADLATPPGSTFVLGPSVPGRWSSSELGTAATITYSFAVGDGYPTGETNAGGRIVPLDAFMPFDRAAIEREIRRAFDAWEAVANVKFVEIPDDGANFDALFTASGDIRIGGHAFDGAGGTIAHGYFPPSFLVSATGDIHFDTAETWTIGYEGEGFDIAQVAAHEIGHALGLNHTTQPGSLMNARYSEAFWGPQASDIAGAVYLYGPPVTVPEPSALLLMCLGAMTLAGRRSGRLGSGGGREVT